MSEQKETPATPATTAPEYVQISRKEFDAVLQLGGNEAAAKEAVGKMTAEQRKKAELWLRQLLARKTPGVFLIFPVSKEQQTNAGRMFFSAVANLRRTLRSANQGEIIDELFGEVESPDKAVAVIAGGEDEAVTE